MVGFFGNSDIIIYSKRIRWKEVSLLSKKKDTRPVKCPHCEKQLPRGEAIRHTNRRYYHKKCYDIATRDSRHYKELIDTICRIYTLKQPTGQIVQQLKRYREDPELKCTNKGMDLTLQYYYDVLDNKPEDGHGVGIIPYYYDEAKEQYIKQTERNKSFKNLENNIKTTVHISPSKRKGSKKDVIDIEQL